MVPRPAYDKYIEVNIDEQSLSLREQGACVYRTLVATASNGVGEQYGSECTPRGWHIVRAKIGAGAEANTVFVGRRPTGELYTPRLGAAFPTRDWILTRILWLSGLQPGLNRLGKVDTMRRYIYIHGAPDEHAMGVPSSHGCIKMRNRDVIELFERVAVGTPVWIHGG